jgi:SAM-dependent methyltransferase
VINLSPDKEQVFREAWRVLGPGGKLAVSDIVTDGPLPDEVLSSLSAWANCIAGALDVKDYIAAIEAAGFVDVELKPVYLAPEMVDQSLDELDVEVDPQFLSDGNAYKAIFSAKITAWKPVE